MADIPRYEDWKSQTNLGLMHRRSDLLKKVDQALADYWKDPIGSVTKKQALRVAFEAWINSKGVDGTSRNQTMVQQMREALRKYRNAVGDWTAAPLPAVPARGEIYLAPSFEHANSREREDVKKAFTRAKLLVEAAFRSLRQVPGDVSNTTIYTTWFGAYNAARWKTVWDNIRKIYDALCGKSVLLYYRGKTVTGPTDCLAETDDLTPCDYFGATWKPMNLPGTLDRAYTHIFLGKDFFTSGVYAGDATGGVLIHELTHAICGTNDVVHNGSTTYGEDLCKQLATDRPDSAITNADSYEYLCENYQSRLYQPRPLNLHLPPKKSISLP